MKYRVKKSYSETTSGANDFLGHSSSRSPNPTFTHTRTAIPTSIPVLVTITLIAKSTITHSSPATKTVNSSANSEMTTITLPSNPSGTDIPTDSSSPSPSLGLILGISIPAAIFILFLGAITYYLLRRHRRKAEAQQRKSENPFLSGSNSKDDFGAFINSPDSIYRSPSGSRFRTGEIVDA